MCVFVIILEYWMKLNIKRFLCLALFNIQLWYSLFSYKYTIHLKLNIKIEYWKNFDVLFCSLFTSYLIWHNWNCLKWFPWPTIYHHQCKQTKVSETSVVYAIITYISGSKIYFWTRAKHRTTTIIFFLFFSWLVHLHLLAV